jgi:hypothetical protein
VFALSGEQLGEVVPADGPRVLQLSSGDVFARGNASVQVEGPCSELAEEALAVFDGFWSGLSGTTPGSDRGALEPRRHP